MKLLNSLPITVKSLILTLISALIVIGVVSIAASSFVAFQAANDLQDKSVNLMSQARDAWIDLARGQAALYWAINLKAQNVEIGIVRAVKNEATQAISRSKRSLASLRVSTPPLDTQLVTDAVKAVDAYAQSAMQAAAFVEEDAFNTTMFMTDAEQKFGIAEQGVSSLVAAAVELTGAIDDQMSSMMHARLLTMDIGAAIALLLSIAASTLMGRLIAKPITVLTDAMRRLASGDLTVEVSVADRKDEVGQMAQAMQVFRQNAREARRLQAAADNANALKARRQAAMDRHTQDFGASVAGVMASLGRSAEAMRATAADMSEAAQRTRDRAVQAEKVRQYPRPISVRSQPQPKRCRRASMRSANKCRVPFMR